MWGNGIYATEYMSTYYSLRCFIRLKSQLGFLKTERKLNVCRSFEISKAQSVFCYHSIVVMSDRTWLFAQKYFTRVGEHRCAFQSQAYFGSGTKLTVIGKTQTKPTVFAYKCLSAILNLQCTSQSFSYCRYCCTKWFSLVRGSIFGLWICIEMWGSLWIEQRTASDCAQKLPGWCVQKCDGWLRAAGFYCSCLSAWTTTQPILVEGPSSQSWVRNRWFESVKLNLNLNVIVV